MAKQKGIPLSEFEGKLGMKDIIRVVQDWEYAEEITPDDWETIDIQIDTEAQAIKEAQEWANKTGHRVCVSTSIRYESVKGVEDRGTAPNNPKPIILLPQI